MNIGYDAKRAYHNTTGLGNYSRMLIESLAQFHPDNSYFLFAAKSSRLFNTSHQNVSTVLPHSAFDKMFASYWRSVRIKKQITENRIDIYHGLSNEIPVHLSESKVKTVVTIHDLIYERYPDQYNPIDVRTYRAKAIYACKNTNRVIACSEQTKKDIISYYKISGNKIDVCYQTCNPAFAKRLAEGEKDRIRLKYNLPEKFFLSVGSIIERKNLLTICKAMKLIRGEIDIPLVVIGNGKSYKKLVKEYIEQNGLQKSVIFLSDMEIAEQQDFGNGSDLPAVYQLATAMIYPSFYEGFGIPVLEAMYSGLPVITSNVSCLPEVGGDAVIYVDPENPEQIANATRNLVNDAVLTDSMREKGWRRAEKFSPEKCAGSVMNTYRQL